MESLGVPSQVVVHGHDPNRPDGMRRDVRKALHQAWLVAYKADSPDLVAALAQRTRYLQDGRNPLDLSPDVLESLHRYEDSSRSRPPTSSAAGARSLPMSGHKACAREAILGAVGVTNWHAALDARNRRNFMILPDVIDHPSMPEDMRPRRVVPLFDYWGIDENVLQVLCLRPDLPRTSMPAYMMDGPWPAVRETLGRWRIAFDCAECRA